MERQQTSKNTQTLCLGLILHSKRVWRGSNPTIALTVGEPRVDNASDTSNDDSFKSDPRHFQSPYPSQHLEVANPSPVSVRSENQTSERRLIESSAGSPSGKSQEQFPSQSHCKVGMKRQCPALTNSGDKRRHLEVDNPSPSSYLSVSNVSPISDISQRSGEHLVSENHSETSDSCVSSNVSTNISDRNPPLRRICLPVGRLCDSEPSLTTHPPCDIYRVENPQKTGVNRRTHNRSTWETQCTEARPNTGHLIVINTSDSSTPVSRTCCLVIVMIFVFAVIAGGVAAYEVLQRNQDPVLPHVYVAEIDVKVNETFRDAMSDTTSAEFKQYQNRFCYNVGVSMSPTLDIKNCSVHNLSRGSVGVAYRLHFTADRNMTASDLEQLIRKPAEEGTPLAHIGIIKVFANSLRVTSCEDAVEQNTGTNDGSGEPQDEFDCSKTTLDYLPLPYTFDGFCHEYQLCINGKSELFSCAEGHEYSYSGNGDSVVCEPASESTYCGVKRKTLGLTTPTTTAAATTTTTTTTTTTQNATWTVLSTYANGSESTSATTDVTSVSTETTTATLHNCTSPVMQENMYTCPDRGVSYIPDPNIYPDQCGNFIWCVDGRAYPYHCANGTHFTLGPEPCYWTGSPLTYCSTVKRWEDCRQGIVSSTTFEPVTATPPRDLMNTFSCAGVIHGFLPMTDTYPDNCGKYHQCVREAEYIQSCPQGLHFTLQGGVCIPQNSTNTYCEQRKRS